MSLASVYKAVNLAVDEVKFLGWKEGIREGAKLSEGSVIFTYEYVHPARGIVKVEKFKSKINGVTVKKLCELRPGDMIKNKITALFSYDRCSHPVKLNDMCGVCGEIFQKGDGPVSQLILHNSNLAAAIPRSAPATTVLGLSSIPAAKARSSASIPMLHSEPHILVDEEEALDLGRQHLVNLVRSRKLVLLVDLDHTLIHTTNENVSPDLPDVHHYELAHKNVWYHTKFRPGCQAFLEQMSRIYELHVVTFGERNYAHTIARLMDPDHKYFHDRILSRNEIFNPSSKTDNLKALFPRGDLMVCIIDDREDVWNYARNLVCVKPYVYFKNTGDINDPNTFNKKSSQRKRKLNAANNSDSSRASPLDEDSNSSSSQTEPPAESEVSAAANQHPQDTDDYLTNLASILTRIHDEYYRIYKERIALRRRIEEVASSPASTPTSSLKPESSQKLGPEPLIESDLPDVKKVLPLIKSRILDQCVITFSGVIPTGYELRKQKCYLMASSLGAKVNEEVVIASSSEEKSPDNKNEKEESQESSAAAKLVYKYEEDDSRSSSSGGAADYKSEGLKDASGDSPKRVRFTLGSDEQQQESTEDNLTLAKRLKRFTTHLVAAKYGTCKVHDALKSKRAVHVVTPEWLIESNFKWERCDENQYRLSKDYEYKNCAFHQEYNSQQKFTSAAAVSNASKISADSTFLVASLARTVESSRNGTRIIKNESSDSLNDDSASNLNQTKKSRTAVALSIEEQRIDDEDDDDDHGSPASLAHSSSEHGDEGNYENSDDGLLQPLNEDIFQQMDKEVDEELDEDDDEDEEENNGGEDGDVNLTDETSSDSTGSQDSLNDDSIEDQLALELERDIFNKKK